MRLKSLQKRLALLLTVALLLPGMLIAKEPPKAYAAEGPNLFQNGDFEVLDSNRLPVGWSMGNYSNATTAKPVYAVDEAVYKVGTHSYKLSAADNKISRGSIKQDILLSPDLNGKPMKLQFWVKTDRIDESSGGPRAYARIQTYNSKGARIGGVNETTSFKGTNDWTLVEKSFAIPKDSDAVRITFEAFLEYTAGTAWFDDLRMFEVLPDDPPPKPQDGNLLSNGGFEKTEPSSAWAGNVGPVQVTTWRASGNPVFSVDSTVFHSGTKSARIDGAPPAASRGAVVQETTALAIGKPYLVSGWVKTKDVSSPVVVRLQYKRNGGQSVIVPLLSEAISGTTDWTPFHQVVTLPDTTDNPAAPSVKVEAFLENATGTVWFDDFSIKEHVPLQEFTLAPEIVELQTGQSAQIQTVFTPADASLQQLTWSSSDPVSVAVYQDGRIFGLSPGYSILSAVSAETKTTRRVAVSVDAPGSLTVQPYSGTVAENGELQGRLLANDSTQAAVTFEVAVGPSNGKLTLQPDGGFRYYPNRYYSGADEFTYLVRTPGGVPKFNKARLMVTPDDKPPVLDLLWYSTAKDTPLTGKLGNVLSPDANSVTWAKAADPQGQLVIQANGAFTYTPKPGFVGYETFQVAATGKNGLRTEGSVNVFVVPDKADFSAKLAAQGNANVHPRLLANDSDFAAIRGLVGQDRYVTEWFDKLKQATDPLLGQAPYPYLANGGSTGNIRDLLINTSLMYQLTKEPRYAERAIQELESAAGFADWGGRYNNMLSLTYLSYSAAFAYDLLYNVMTPEQRTTVELAIVKHALTPALEWYRGGFTHNGEFNNINFVDNGSFGLTALALLGEGGAANEAAGEVLQGVYRKLQNSLRFYNGDGSWPEGPSYFQYGTMPLFLMMASLNKSMGTDYGLTSLEGIRQTGSFPVHMQGPGGFFNFYDGDILLPHPQSLWLADFFNRPDYAWQMGELYRTQGVYSPFYLLFYKPGMFDTQPTGLDHEFAGIASMTMRSSWEDPNGTYAAIKGFKDPLLSHLDMDAGSFVFDALGERWALDPGNENYNLPGYWDAAQGTRWTYYRKGAQGHNTVVINPLSNPVHMQDYDATAPLVHSESKPRGALGIVDLTDRYPLDAVSFQRGMMLTGNRDQLIVQDEMKLKAPSELYWFMHTKASIRIIEDGRAAILSQKDKKLYVKMLDAPAGAVFTSMSAEPLPGTPNPSGQAVNVEFRKLAVHMTNMEEGKLSIWMVPLSEYDPLPTEAPAFVPLSGWAIPDGELPAKPVPPVVTNLTADGKTISGFVPSRTYYEIVVPYEETAVPKIEAASNFPVSTSPAASIPGKTVVTVTDPANPGNVNRYTVSFLRGPIVGDPPDINRLPVTSVKASAVPQADQGFTPDKTLDRDLTTRWTAEGPQWIQYDLGQEREIGAVSIAFISGNARKSYFSIATSLDGETWSTVYADGVSSGTTNEPEVYHFPSTKARYVQINGFGNSANRWNNYAEVGIFRTTPVSVRVEAPAVWKTGEKRQLAAWLTFADGTQALAQKAEFVSSDGKNMKIGENGLGHALRAGDVQLTVYDREYGLQGMLNVTVKTGAGTVPDNLLSK
ncbi:Ig-like domain-containing protein [Paenibacillus sp. J31TS4]|uniref:Ig-like domain-containing protein n=1 Tax=Paenibacillus sp. J31TS4 TaxID=2807195 RepID=UPI001BCD6047|nr:Ig-like domain-containing protein [Paenibacillus sp. J31TS4]